MILRLIGLLTIATSYWIVDVSISNAGLNKFTKIDAFDNWIIEQKFDTGKERVLCRASLKGYVTWFGGKVRLNDQNKLVYPPDTPLGSLPSPIVLERLELALKNCRSGLLYIPMRKRKNISDLS